MVKVKSPRIIGDFYEDIAVDYLVGLGYKILERNFYCRKGEIDIIACENDILVFVEVRARRSGFMAPEESIDHKKIRRLTYTAEFYLKKKPWNRDIRFDLIAISEDGLDQDSSSRKIVHLKDII